MDTGRNLRLDRVSTLKCCALYYMQQFGSRTMKTKTKLHGTVLRVRENPQQPCQPESACYAKFLVTVVSGLSECAKATEDSLLLGKYVRPKLM